MFAGVAALSKLRHLAALTLQGSPHITDAGVARLPAAACLERVCLRGLDGLTDVGLSQLARLQHLTELRISKCGAVTGAAHVLEAAGWW